MNKSKWVLYALPLIGFLVLGYVFSQALKNDPSLLPSTRLSQPVPAFSLPLLADAGTIVTQEKLKGPLLLNVWGTWCPSCQLEHPMLLKLAENGIQIVGLNYKDHRQAALKYLELHGNPFQYNVFDEQGNLGLDLGVYGAPETFLIDADGIIRDRLVGVITPEVWREKLWPQWQAMGGTRP